MYTGTVFVCNRNIYKESNILLCYDETNVSNEVKMNKTQILKRFKNTNSIKKTILNYKSDSEIKDDYIQQIKEQFISNETDKPITDKEIKEHLKEDDKGFSFFNTFVFKNRSAKESIINRLTSDIKTTSIKEYDKIKGNWFKTEFAKYELKGD